MKSFRPKDGSGEPPAPGRNGERDFHGEQRTNDTHASTTDPEARLFRKGDGKEAKLCFMGHVLMENRHGLVVDGGLDPRPPAPPSATGRRCIWPRTCPAGTGSPSAATRTSTRRDFVAALRELGVTPHVAQNTTNRRSAIDGRTTRHPGYALSQQKPQADRGGLRLDQGDRPAAAARPGSAGKDRVGWQFTLALAAYNLIRLPKLLAQAA